MALGETNLTMTAIRDALSESTRVLRLLCQSAEVNKWGIHRCFGSGSTGALRLTNISTAPYVMGHFRGYSHSLTAPGVIAPVLESFTDDAQDEPYEIHSLGAYEITRQEWNGSSWDNIAHNTVSWFRIERSSPGDENHTVTVNGVSGHVEGCSSANAACPSYHQLEANLRLKINSLSSGERKGRVILSHPDDGDDDAKPPYVFPLITEFTQSVVSYTWSVTPSSFSFIANKPSPQFLGITWGGSGINYAVIDKVDTGDGTSWCITTEQTVNTSPHSQNVSCQNNTGSQRSCQIRVRFYESGTPAVLKETETRTVTQLIAPS